jgi:hypothetical protein
VASVGVGGTIVVWKDAHEEEAARKHAITKNEALQLNQLDLSLRENRHVGKLTFAFLVY